MLKEFPDAVLTVCAAAVADFAPSEIHKEKIKKENIKKWNLELTLNPDILSELGRIKRKDQVLVGFALETSSPLENGQKKLKEKNADLIIVNQAIQKGKPVFGSDYNECTVLDTTGKTFSYQSLTKEELAEQLTELFIRYLHEK
jgi:phosphopantothenoylcysteine decarboxylase/phosphopantothenate--cysteine ligase